MQEAACPVIVLIHARDPDAALQQFPREREAGSVAANPLSKLEVVGAVGAGKEPRALRGFIQRPAQRGWSLAGISLRWRSSQMRARRR